jgi:hypothetical protein
MSERQVLANQLVDRACNCQILLLKAKKVSEVERRNEERISLVRDKRTKGKPKTQATKKRVRVGCASYILKLYKEQNTVKHFAKRIEQTRIRCNGQSAWNK